ncbi:hypothetical protein ES708_10393 [subsurface metagenome]
MELPDWMRGLVLIGKKGEEWHIVGVDGEGVLTALMKGQIEDAGEKTIAVDAEGRLITLLRGRDGNLLAVDTSGFMTAVLKGWTGTAYQTLGADAEGNITALLKDNTDQWGKKISVGIAELAARLGSPISWDRRGQVVQIITFENGFGNVYHSGAFEGGGVFLCPTTFMTGGYSAKLDTGTAITTYADLYAFGDFPPSTRLGFEWVFSAEGSPSEVTLFGKIWDGADEHKAHVNIDGTTNKIQVWKKGGGYHDVADFEFTLDERAFISIKAVIDIGTEHWVRLMVRGEAHDLSAVETAKETLVTYPYVECGMKVVEKTAAQQLVYLDRMVVTTNEP